MAEQRCMSKEKFKLIRDELGLSVNDMANALNLSDGTHVREMERGKRMISGPVSKLMIIYYEHPLLIEKMRGR